MTSPGDVPYMGVGEGGQSRGQRGWGKDLSNENLCQGVLHLNTARSAAVPSLPAAPPPPSQRSLRCWLASPAPRRVLNKLEGGRSAGVKLGKLQLPRS